jgi:MoxR-like ATPase
MTMQELAERITVEVGKAVVGQREPIEQVLVALLARGHVLLEGVPGVAKTLLAKAIAHCLGCTFKRVQFTPDLMPADIIGTNVFDLNTRAFRLARGPIFTNVLLADEINRTPPKTQAALLEAMEERTVTIDGTLHPLPAIFLVLATQNPIEYEGTYPLPEAQLDRFLMKVIVGYPSAEDDVVILRRHDQGFDPHDFQRAGVAQVTDEAGLSAVRQELSRQTVRDEIIAYVSEVVRMTRQSPHVLLGASPRAGVALLMCAKTLAALRGRDYVTPDDVQEMAMPVLRHRIMLRPEAEIEGLSAERLIGNVMAGVAVPR